MCRILVLFAALLGCLTVRAGATPVSANGKLRVSGTQLVNSCGNPIQLRGWSTHNFWMYGWGSCITPASVSYLANDVGADVFRAAMYLTEGSNGYLNDMNGNMTQLNNMVTEATNQGMYCIIDWHVLTPGDPNTYVNQAVTFWKQIANTYKSYPNVLYEICNEPNGSGVSWDTVKNYANQVIPAIRAIDPNTVILVGTPNWSQLGSAVTQAPLTQYTNLMYVCHFYAGTHSTSLISPYIGKIPLFVSEWGVSNTSGNGGDNYAVAQQWMDLLSTNKISWCNWSYGDKSESTAGWKNGTCNAKNFVTSQLSQSGVSVRYWIQNPADSFVTCGASTPTFTVTPSPTRTNTPVPTATRTSTPSWTPTSSFTGTPTATRTNTPVFTSTATWTGTSTSTPTGTPTQTRTFTAVNTPTPTSTSSSTATGTATPTRSFTAVFTLTSTRTSTSTATGTPTPTRTSTAVNTPTWTSTATNSPTATRSFTSTPTGMPSSTWTPSPTPTLSPTRTETATWTATATWTGTPTFTWTRTFTPTWTGTFTASETPTVTGTATWTVTGTQPPTDTATSTPTDTRTGTPTFIPTSTPTPTPSSTATPSGTPTPTRTFSPVWTATGTSTPSATATASRTATSVWTLTPSATASATATPSGTPTPTRTFSPVWTTTATSTPSSTASPTATRTPSATASPTATSTASHTATPTETVGLTATPVPTGTPTPASLLGGPVVAPNPVMGPGPITVFFPVTGQETQVRLVVVTVANRKVLETMVFGPFRPGTASVLLNLVDSKGKPLANGLYYVFVAGKGGPVGKFAVLR